MRFLALPYFCFSLCCSDKSTTVRVSIQLIVRIRTKFYLPTMLSYTRTTLKNVGNFLVFCLHKNTKLQNETSMYISHF